jgi:4-hydroxybenzoyl-CoA reductase subunit alpha
MSKHRILNTRARRVDAVGKVTGSAQYVDDLRRPRMLYAALLQSPVAHGTIRKLDTSRAAALPGVVKVVTAEEAGDTHYGVSPARYDETVFAIDKVRYLGEEIAAVAAEDPDTATSRSTSCRWCWTRSRRWRRGRRRCTKCTPAT